MKLTSLILSLMIPVCAQAAMVRVVSVDDARSITVEENGRRVRIQLAGLVITDAARASDLLRWTIGTSWVLIEPHAGGGHLVWRSPDALFVNRELVVRGYARATTFGIEPESNLNVTYLGQIDPPLSPPTARRTRSGSDRRSTTPPSRTTPGRGRGGRGGPAKSPGPAPKAP
jgi:hypothetical protein